MNRRILTSIASGLALAGCAEERSPINRVQPDWLDKSFFVGEKLQDLSDDPEFYMQGTLVDVGFGASQDGLFTSTYAQPLSRVKFQITENYLIARIAYERIENTDGKGVGASSNDGVIAAMYRIRSHFDISKAYNSTTGEELNIVVENTSDRPWYERQHFRVDWSSNLATDTYDFDTLSLLGVYGGIRYEPMDYYVNDPADPEAPHFDLENGYFDVTVKAFAKPEMIDLSMFNWGINQFPACFLDADFLNGSGPTGNCNPSEITIRQAFMKVPKSDFEAQDWDGWRFQAFGSFTVERYGYDRNYGLLDAKWHRFISRYNIWDRHHYYADPVNMEGAVSCNTAATTPWGEDPNRDLDDNGTADECEAVGRGSRCNAFAQKCTLPFRDRVAKPVIWHYTEENDQQWWDPTHWATHEWDVAMRSAVMTARYAECQRTGDEDCSKYPVYFGQQDENDEAIRLAREVDDCREGRAYPERNRDEASCVALADEIGNRRGYSAGVIAVAKHPQMLVLCHSPIEANDPAECQGTRLPAGISALDCQDPETEDIAASCKAATSARRGDLRYHQVNVITEPQTGSPWGIMTDAEDPLTGETISASINIWSMPTDRWSQNIIDQARYINGELSDADITEGTHIHDFASAARVASSSGAMPQMTRQQKLERIGTMVGRSAEQLSQMQMPSELRTLALQARKEASQFQASATASSKFAPVYSARRQAAAGTEVEAALMTPAMMALSGVNGMPLSENIRDLASPLRAANPSVQRDIQNLKEIALAERGACMVNEAPTPLALADFSGILQEKFGAFNPNDSKDVQLARAERMRQYVAQRAHFGVIIHEMGHSVGLRHNFVSSSDAFGFRPQYWQLRTKNGAVTNECTDLVANGENCVGPRYFDPMTENENKNLIWMFMQSSVMEYPGEGTQELHGLGAYDFAAARSFYGDVVSVFADASYNRGTQRGRGMLSKMDNFGGILGFQPAYGSDDIHYSQYNKYFELIKDCQEVDPYEYKPANWNEDQFGAWHPVMDGRIVPVDGKYTLCKQQPVDYVNWDKLVRPTAAESNYRSGPALDKNNRVRVPYGFGTDNWADLGNLSVYRNDNGADPYELFNFLITQQEVSHIFDNYRRGRQDFSVRRSAYRTFGRYNEKLRDAAKGLGLMKNIYKEFTLASGYNFDDFWPYAAKDFFHDNILTSGIAFDHFTRQLQRPQSGSHFRVQGDPVLRSTEDYWGNPGQTRVNIPNGATGRFGNVAYGGRPLNNALAETYGEYDSGYTINAGSYYDKSFTALLMTESVDNFISSSRGDFYDARYRSVSIADLFPDGYRRWLANNLTNDHVLTAPHIEANASGNPLVNNATERYPSGGIGWTSWWPEAGPERCFPNVNSTVCSIYGLEGTNPFKPEAPANTVAIDPQVGWEQQKFLIAWTLVYLPENQQQWWIDMLRLWEIGVETDPGFANRIEFHNPMGKTYVAKTSGTEVIFGKTVQKSIAARVLEYANELSSKAYEGQWVNSPDGVSRWYIADINPTTGRPVVKFDPSIAAITPDGNIDSAGSATCNATNSTGCTCAANRACRELESYVQVPYFLRQAVATMGFDNPSWKGVY